jgi:cytochrome c biogenesis protein ResB
VFAGVLGPVALLIVTVIVINVLQAYVSTRLPKWLQTWSWLPRPLRSLAWYDERIFVKQCCRFNQRAGSSEVDAGVHQNDSYVDEEQSF